MSCTNIQVHLNVRPLVQSFIVPYCPTSFIQYADHRGHSRNCICRNNSTCGHAPIDCRYSFYLGLQIFVMLRS
ncbi:hypothetical protein ARMSODRAFT_615070 [Armillaria solidipes]|uniref:Uncharacterized protein n=1 Tax=Armillaria solidipes TaxID=1076256 RepID=A0A2H3B4X6_9AGAR|nr:hypothetical protein ARMSODRAFT_615070 [Armillaria solidipes]